MNYFTLGFSLKIDIHKKFESILFLKLHKVGSKLGFQNPLCFELNFKKSKMYSFTFQSLGLGGMVIGTIALRPPRFLEQYGSGMQGGPCCGRFHHVIPILVWWRQQSHLSPPCVLCSGSCDAGKSFGGCFSLLRFIATKGSVPQNLYSVP